MLQVLKLFLASRNAAIKEVHFPAELGPSFVYTTPEAVNEAVNLFLGIEASGGSRGSLEDGREESGGKGKKKGGKGKTEEDEGQARKPHLEKLKPPGSDGLVPAREAGELEAKSAARKLGSASPSSTRADCRRAPTTRKATATSTSRIRASTTSKTPMTSATPPTA